VWYIGLLRGALLRVYRALTTIPTNRNTHIRKRDLYIRKRAPTPHRQENTHRALITIRECVCFCLWGVGALLRMYRSLLRICRALLRMYRLMGSVRECVCVSVCGGFYIPAKAPYISAKETYTSAKETHTSAKEPCISVNVCGSVCGGLYISAKELYIRALRTHKRALQKVLYTRKRALDKSPIYPQNSPTQEPYISAKEPNIREPYISHKRAQQKRPIYPQKSPT